jgi:hypothetical protein
VCGSSDSSSSSSSRMRSRARGCCSDRPIRHTS